MVRDDEAKRMEIQKAMKAFAAQRLKTQVETLETEMGSFKHLDHTIYLLDLDCFLFHLHVVKKFLMSKSCSIVVCIEVIQALDIMKKENIHAVQAREAIRYLEQRFKYPSPFLIGQKPDETASCWSSEGVFEGITIPNSLQKILKACLFFQNQSVQRICGDGFYLVTDTLELKETALHLKIPQISIHQFLSKLKRKL